MAHSRCWKRPAEHRIYSCGRFRCGDVGCYGQALIKTPHLDRLALEGMRFERHFSGSAVCAPSRCVLLTGLHPGHASIRNNRETKPEGQWAIPENSRTLATRLKARGYATGIFGKWGLGGPGTTGEPLRQGFDRFYGYNCQAMRTILIQLTSGTIAIASRLETLHFLLTIHSSPTNDLRI